MTPEVRVLGHPLAKHCLAQLRNETTPPALFRSVTRQLSTLLAIEATRDLRTAPVRIDTPMESTLVELIDEKLVVVPILRAGLGMLEAVVQLFPDVLVGYLGLERDEHTAKASVYYSKLPVVRDRTVLLVDPMLATGGSSCHALSDIYSYSPARVILVCIVAAPEGVAAVNERFPQTEIVTAALDRELNSRKYILPGLGDFGDRLYGTF